MYTNTIKKFKGNGFNGWQGPSLAQTPTFPCGINYFDNLGGLTQGHCATQHLNAPSESIFGNLYPTPAPNHNCNLNPIAVVLTACENLTMIVPWP